MERKEPLRRTPMRRTGRPRAKRTTPRRREAPQETVEWWFDATMALLRRSGGRCEKCGRALVNEMERHHRQRRRDGGDRLSNLLALHSACHGWITGHPEEAREQGWIVPAFIADPSTVRVWIDGGWWMLDDDGGKTAA